MGFYVTIPPDLNNPVFLVLLRHNGIDIIKGYDPAVHWGNIEIEVGSEELAKKAQQLITECQEVSNIIHGRN